MRKDGTIGKISTRAQIAVGASTLIVFVGFMAVQWHLEFGQNQYYIGTSPTLHTDYYNLAYRMMLTALRFVGVAGVAVLLVVRGHRRAFFVPALLLAFSPLVTGGLTGCTPIDSGSLQGIDTGWSYAAGAGCGVFAAPLANVWIGLVVVLLPAAILAWATRADAAAAKRDALPSIASAGLTLLLLFGCLAIGAAGGAHGYTWFQSLAIYLPLFAVGLIFGLPARLRAGAILVVLAALVQPLGWVPAPGAMLHIGAWNVTYPLGLAAAVVLGSSSELLAERWQRIRQLRSTAAAA